MAGEQTTFHRVQTQDGIIVRSFTVERLRAPMATQKTRFESLFSRWASHVRRRLTLRTALTGMAVGLMISLVLAGFAWKTRHGSWRPLAATAGGLGVMVGLFAS